MATKSSPTSLNMSSRKRSRSTSGSELPLPVAPAASSSSQHKSKKLKLHSSYVETSPFPDFHRPTRREAYEVYELLKKSHPGLHTTRRPISGPSGSSHNGVPNVIEGLISVILSQNTSGRNSSAAKSSLDNAFGRNNFSAIAFAPRADVVDAIKHGGLANKKAATIQNLLASIKEKHGGYSLQHLTETQPDRRLSDDAIMKELISYDGVGPKTASCVLLFTLGRDSFAVDTHIYRLCRVLGWIPNTADRVLAQAHLDLKVPAELKYGLHILLIQHGRTCSGCKKSGSGTGCILKSYLKERIAPTSEGGTGTTSAS